MWSDDESGSEAPSEMTAPLGKIVARARMADERAQRVSETSVKALKASFGKVANPAGSPAPSASAVSSAD